ncbi:MAG: hypothetical protein AAF533_04935 [Acidobacteriota bacterium]
MTSPHVTRFLTLLAVLLVPGCSAADPTVSALEVGQSVRFQYRSQGLLRSLKADITVRRDDRLVAELEVPDSEGRPRPIQLVLSDRDRERLDAAIAYYRVSPEGECWHVDEVDVTWNLAGGEKVEESLTDETCKVDTREDLMSLFELVLRGMELPPPVE